MRGDDGELLRSFARHAAGAVLSFVICLVADLVLLALDRVLPAGEMMTVLLLTALFLAYLACLLTTEHLLRRLDLASDERTAAEWLTPLGAAAAFMVAMVTGHYLLAWSPDRLLSTVPIYFLAPVLFHILLQVHDGESAWLMPSTRVQPEPARQEAQRATGAHERAHPGGKAGARIRT